MDLKYSVKKENQRQLLLAQQVPSHYPPNLSRQNRISNYIFFNPHLSGIPQYQPTFNNLWNNPPVQTLPQTQSLHPVHQTSSTNKPVTYEQPQNQTQECTQIIGCYSRPERKERLNRYRNKRSKRNYDSKKIRYNVRCDISKKRDRCKGRFVKATNELEKPTNTSAIVTNNCI